MNEYIKSITTVQNVIYSLKKGLRNVELLRTSIKKYDSKKATESKRFAVLTNTNFTYYFTEQGYIFNPEKYIARIDLKDISIVKKYTTKTKNQKTQKNEEKLNLDIYASKCYRRNKTKGARVFRFSTYTKDSLISWYSALEIARLNSIYQGCCNDYGKFGLPFIEERREQIEFEGGWRGIEFNDEKVSGFYFNFLRRKNLSLISLLSGEWKMLRLSSG